MQEYSFLNEMIKESQYNNLKRQEARYGTCAQYLGGRSGGEEGGRVGAVGWGEKREWLQRGNTPK